MVQKLVGHSLSQARRIHFLEHGRDDHHGIDGPPAGVIADQHGATATRNMVDAVGFREQAVGELLSSGTCPARNINQNVADLKAQIAANAKGV